MKFTTSKKSIAITASLLIAISTYAAGTYSYSLKHHPRPRKGCYPVDKMSVAEAQELLASQNLSVEGATNYETKVLGAVIYWVQYLNDGVLKTGSFSGRKRYPFRVTNASGSAQRGDHIRIGRGSKEFGKSAAQYAHEWGHLIGNNGTYAKYRSYMKGHGYCKVSGYSTSKPNEQFGEVFAAFVTEPNILRNNSASPRACKRAYNFFLNWFDAGNRNLDCQH